MLAVRTDVHPRKLGRQSVELLTGSGLTSPSAWRAQAFRRVGRRAVYPRLPDSDVRLLCYLAVRSGLLLDVQRGNLDGLRLLDGGRSLSDGVARLRARDRRMVGDGSGWAFLHARDRDEVDRPGGVRTAMRVVLCPCLRVGVRVCPVRVVHVRRAALLLGGGRRGLLRLLLRLTLLLRLGLSLCLRLTLRLCLDLWLHLRLSMRLDLRLSLRLVLRLGCRLRLRLRCRLSLLLGRICLLHLLGLERLLRLMGLLRLLGLERLLRLWLHSRASRIALRLLGGGVRRRARVPLGWRLTVHRLLAGTIRIRIAILLGLRGRVRLNRGRVLVLRGVCGRRGGVSVVSRLLVHVGIPPVRLGRAWRHLRTSRREVFLAGARIWTGDVGLTGCLNVWWTTIVYCRLCQYRFLYVQENGSEHTSCVTSKTVFHHSVEDGPSLHERLVHRHEVSWRRMFRNGVALEHDSKQTSLLAVLINQLHDLRPERHAGPVQFLRVDI